MATHFLQQGAPQGWQPPTGQNSCLRYPAPEITCQDIIDKMSGHRTGTGFTDSRILDFRDCEREPRFRGRVGDQTAEGIAERNKPENKLLYSGLSGAGWRNQQSLRQYYMENMHDTLAEGDELVLLAIPPCYDLQTIYWMNECPVPGFEFTIRMECAELDIATVDAGEVGCNLFEVPFAQRMRQDVTEIIKIVIDAFPEAPADKCERPINHGKLSNACFMVSATGFCISSGK